MSYRLWTFTNSSRADTDTLARAIVGSMHDRVVGIGTRMIYPDINPRLHAEVMVSARPSASELMAAASSFDSVMLFGMPAIDPARLGLVIVDEHDLEMMLLGMVIGRPDALLTDYVSLLRAMSPPLVLGSGLDWVLLRDASQ